MERLRDNLPEFLTDDNPVQIENPGEFINEGDPQNIRSRFFKTSRNTVKSIILEKVELKEGDNKRSIKLFVTQEDQDFKTDVIVGTLTADGLIFAENSLSYCGVNGCEPSSFTEEEKAIIVQALGTSVIETQE